MNAEAYCREQATPPGSTLYYCLLYQARADRRGLRALFALECELQQIIARNTDPGLARLRLQWWLGEVERVFCHTAQHPIGIELQEMLQRQGVDQKIEQELDQALGQTLDQALLVHSINALERHLQDSIAADCAAWINELGQYRGKIWRNAALVCACEDPASLAVAEETGAVLAALDVLQQLPRYLHSGLCPLPLAQMQQHGVTLEMLQQGSDQKALRALFSDLLGGIAGRLAALPDAIPRCDRQKLLFCRVALCLALKLCTAIRRANYCLLERRIMLTPIRRLLLAWHINWQIKWQTK